MMRSGICQGKMFPFGVMFTKFIQETGFRNVQILTSTLSPVKRDRNSNREIPELFCYVNDFLHKESIASGQDFYSKHQIRKFGYWLEGDKKHAHQELEEMMMAGAAQKLLKAFNKVDIPTTLYVIFTTGGIDFVGGYTYYQFLKSA